MFLFSLKVKVGTQSDFQKIRLNDTLKTSPCNTQLKSGKEIRSDGSSANKFFPTRENLISRPLKFTLPLRTFLVFQNIFVLLSGSPLTAGDLRR